MKHPLALLTLACAAGTALAQDMKPGLWEIQNKMGGGPQADKMQQHMAQMQQQMASMPPEQRKMIEDLMAKQGVQMGAATGGGMSVKVCLTKEMIERREMPANQRGDCKSEVSPRVGNTMKVKFSCSRPASSGEGTYTFLGPEAYKFNMVMTHQEEGKPQTMTMDGAGKWLGADCGPIKPMQPPKQ